MRIKITLFSEKEQSLNINYNYYLSSLIYNLLRQSNMAYSEFLHDSGYENNNKFYKLFTFSQLFPEKYKIEGSNLIVKGKVVWYITSPIKEFLMYFVGTISSNTKIYIDKAAFQVINIETKLEPRYKQNMKFKCLSPITISTAYLDQTSKLKPIMLYLEDKKFTENIIKNLTAKYELLSGKKTKDADLKISFFNIEKYKRGRLINYKDNIKVKGYLAPFEIEGNPELIQVAYECGMGDKNSLGMGMIEVY